MSILSMSTGLFLMFTLYICILTDRLAERNLRFAQLNIYFVAFF